jgi:amino acid transporter
MARTESQLGTGDAVKRLILGRPLATSRLEHERLGRATALAIFSSDNMSSVAYATEEILRVLIPAVGMAAFALVLPVSAAIVLVEAVLIFSYRQTIKAYPTAGGAYIVTKDNLGLLPAQVAGVALLIDYVLTVSVSTAAGVQAISSVVPLSVPSRIVLSLVFVWMIAYGNLLGVRESGRIFAAPTFLFIASLALTCGVGIYEVLTGHVQPFPVGAQETNGGLTLGAGAVGMFVVLRAFASGGAAVTGVEAISNGVPAFRRPEWRNAQITLGYMGAILGSTFLAVSFLAHRLHVVPVADESTSVLAQIAQVVYGRGVLGHTLFLTLQIATTLILILAANTSFADFPRLASFHAGDEFMPRQLTKRGHRLVFSNGIIALAVAASGVLIVFRASVTTMIPLYALGVFTSFTLSQTGMARRHLHLRERGWRFGLLVNGLGAAATSIVTLIIAVTKFARGAWMVMVAVPVLVAILVRVNRTYGAEERDLRIPADTPDVAPAGLRHAAVLLVDRLDAKTLHAARYALTVGPTSVRAVHVGSERREELLAEWGAARLRIPLEFVHGSGSLERTVADELRARSTAEEQVTLIVPGSEHGRLLERLRLSRLMTGLGAELRGMTDVGVVVVRDHGGPRHHATDTPPRLSLRRRHEVLVMVDRLDRATLAATRYARGVPAFQVRAVHAASDPAAAEHLIADWLRRGGAAGVPLDVEECFDRDIGRSLRGYIARMQDGATEITVVLPRHVYASRMHALLHDRTGRSIARALSREPHVDVVVVPISVREHRDAEVRAATRRS